MKGFKEPADEKQLESLDQILEMVATKRDTRSQLNFVTAKSGSQFAMNSRAMMSGKLKHGTFADRVKQSYPIDNLFIHMKEPRVVENFGRQSGLKLSSLGRPRCTSTTVSYTHLTLPTIYSV